VVVEPIHENAGRGEGVGYFESNGVLVIVNERGECVSSTVGVKSYSEFSERLLAVQVEGKETYLRDDGTLLVQRFELCRDFSGGFGQVQVEGGWGLVDKSGSTVLDFMYQEIGPVNSESSLVPVLKKGVWQLIDVEGKTRKLFDAAALYAGPSTYAVGVRQGKNIKFGLAGCDGNWLIEPRFCEMSRPGVDTVAAKLDDRWELLSFDGYRLFSTDATTLHSVSCGAAAAYFGGRITWDGLEGGKFRFLDRNGTIMFTREFDSTFGFRSGVAEVGTMIDMEGVNWKWGYINQDGVVLWEPSD
jgi:hypothetical protein